jgi:DNA-binding NarL/FixJ family response regulator
MHSWGSLDAREQALTFDLLEALTCPGDLSEVLPRAYDILSRMLAADYAAFCVSKPGKAFEYDWIVEQMPSKFFTHYEELVAEDFVRIAVMRQPNQVLRDTEMGLSRQGLERSQMYQRCRELGMPLEHVMAVMLETGSDWHGGFMLYRDTRMPFSDRERALLQRVTPALAHTVHSRRQQSLERGGRWMLESLLRKRGTECVVLTPSGTEQMRTEGATGVLEAWFAPSDCERNLPRVLLERLQRLVSSVQTLQAGEDIWETPVPGPKLRVTFIPMDVGSRRLWVLQLQETPYIPAAWRTKLTKRELQVAARVLLGWDNQLIAEDLKCSVDTVKKHLQHIFDKLGVNSRAQLLHQATQL